MTYLLCYDFYQKIKLMSYHNQQHILSTDSADSTVQPLNASTLQPLGDSTWQLLFQQTVRFAEYQIERLRWRGDYGGVLPEGYDANSIAAQVCAATIKIFQ